MIIMKDSSIGQKWRAGICLLLAISWRMLAIAAAFLFPFQVLSIGASYLNFGSFKANFVVACAMASLKVLALAFAALFVLPVAVGGYLDRRAINAGLKGDSNAARPPSMQ